MSPSHPKTSVQAISLAPLRVGEILDLSVTILVRISPYLAVLVLVIAAAGEIPKALAVGSIWANLLGGAVKFILLFYLYAATIRLTARIRLNQSSSPWEVLKKISVRDVIGVGVLSAWVYIMTILYMLLLVIPGITYSVNRLLVLPIYLTERIAMGEALWRSKYLMTRGRWYSLSSPLMRVSIVMLVLFLIVGSLTSSLAIREYFGWGDDLGGYARLILGVFGTGLTQLITLFGFVAYTNFYFDLRSRYEGLDLYAALESYENSVAD